MKEKIKLYLQKKLSVFVFYAILFIFFISLCGFTTTVGIIVFFGAYSSSMTANRYGRIKLRRPSRLWEGAGWAVSARAKSSALKQPPRRNIIK